MALPWMHVINLDRSADRLARFTEVNSHLTEITRYSAVDGTALDRTELERTGHITADLRYGNGTVACALSHIRLWGRSVQENRPLTIFEDDAVTCFQFEKKAVSMLQLLPPDWDFIAWGCNFYPSFVWVDVGISKARLHPYGPKRHNDGNNIRSFQVEELPTAPVRLLHSFGLFAYSISPRGARAAIACCRPLRNRLIEFPDAGVRTWNIGVDIALCALYPSIKAFMCLAPLAIHHPNMGSIRTATDG
jgi:GR25 family glycosyltransferase involved in LPS biosynthesis